jgi:tyrosine aminotransferase
MEEIDLPAIQSSGRSHEAVNFIRQIVDRIKLPAADPSKPLIPLSIGDPTLFGNLPPPSGVAEELGRVLAQGKGLGYLNSMGSPEARAAVAKSLASASHPVAADDVCLASGCSHAILLAVEVLCDVGTNILIPAPGFSLYRTLATYLGVQYKEYRLDATKNWEVDLEHLESLVDSKVRVLLFLVFLLTKPPYRCRRKPFL